MFGQVVFPFRKETQLFTLIKIIVFKCLQPVEVGST